MLTTPFSTENQMLTTKGSLRRREINNRYADLIDGLYAKSE